MIGDGGVDSEDEGGGNGDKGVAVRGVRCFRYRRRCTVLGTPRPLGPGSSGGYARCRMLGNIPGISARLPI